MDHADTYTQVKAEQASAVEPVPVVPPPFSTSVTTGQGGAYSYKWNAQNGSARLGNNRAPIPTCGIAVKVAGPSITMTGPGVKDEVQSASSRLADAMLGGLGRERPIFLPNRASESAESTKEMADFQPASDDCSLQHSADSGQVTEDEEADAAAESEGCQPMRQGLGGKTGKEKKKVGRPLAYKGDPNAPELTELERRRIKRRIANRESARRVRHKRQEVLEELQVKMEQLHAHNLSLVHHAQDLEKQRSQLSDQLAELEGKHKEVVDDNGKMQQEICALRQSLQMKMSVLEDELDKRVREAGDQLPTALDHETAAHSGGRLPHPMSSGALIDMSGGQEQCKTPLEWFPSLNIDDLPARGEAWDVLSSFLRDDSQPQQQSQQHGRGEPVC